MTPSLPIVSIVIPAYNHARYLDEAIGSVLAQDYPNVELLVIDDGSTDETPQVLEKYGDRFWWMSAANRGQAAVLNDGWTRARGEILSYLSADDRLAPSAVRRAVEQLQAAPDVIGTYSNYSLIDPQSRVVRVVDADEYRYRDVVGTLDCPIGPGAFFRRDLFEQIGGWNPRFKQSPDFDYWLRAGLIGPLYRIPELLASFRVHEASQSFAKADAQRAEEVVEIVETFFAENNVPPELRELSGKALSFGHLRAARHHVRAGRYGSGWRSLRRAGTLRPASLFTTRAGRLLLNAFVNRAGHRILWRLNQLRRGTR